MLTKEKAVERIDEMLRSRLIAHVRQECVRLLNTGAIEITDYKDDYILPKMIISVALETEAACYNPSTLTPEQKKDRANLRHF